MSPLAFIFLLGSLSQIAAFVQFSVGMFCRETYCMNNQMIVELLDRSGKHIEGTRQWRILPGHFDENNEYYMTQRLERMYRDEENVALQIRGVGMVSKRISMKGLSITSPAYEKTFSNDFRMRLVMSCSGGYYGPECRKGCNEHHRNQCNAEGEWVCRGGFTGYGCFEDLCLNGGTKIGSECQCAEEWTGKVCDECAHLPGCKHGSCSANVTACGPCLPGWRGKDCDEYAFDPLRPIPRFVNLTKLLGGVPAAEHPAHLAFPASAPSAPSASALQQPCPPCDSPAAAAYSDDDDADCACPASSSRDVASFSSFRPSDNVLLVLGVACFGLTALALFAYSKRRAANRYSAVHNRAASTRPVLVIANEGARLADA